MFDGDCFSFVDGCEPNTWLDWERGGCGEDWLIRQALGDDHESEGWALAMKVGISPEQRFDVLFFGYASWGPDHDGDYDSECECELVSIEHRTPADHLWAWEWLFTQWNPPFAAPVLGGP